MILKQHNVKMTPKQYDVNTIAMPTMSSPERRGRGTTVVHYRAPQRLPWGLPELQKPRETSKNLVKTTKKSTLLPGGTGRSVAAKVG